MKGKNLSFDLGVANAPLWPISSTFYSSVLCTKLLFSPKSFSQAQIQNVTRKKLREALLYKIRARKMLMKLTPVFVCLHHVCYISQKRFILVSLM